MDASLVSWLVAALSAILMALALPKTNVAVLAPVGAAGLFWVWFGSSPRRAFLIGFWAGAVYFSLAFAWFSESAGAYIAPFGALLVLGPALLEALAFATTGLLVALAWRFARTSLAPLGAAAAFALLELVRSSGPLALPFANLSYSQVESPLAPLAAFVGSFGMTFGLCVFAAYAAAVARPGRSRDVERAAAFAMLGLLCAVAAAWWLWPARHVATPTTRVAAIQGNIPQTLKWTRAAFDLSNMRYWSLTRQAAASHPALILWPETVVTVDLNLDPSLVAELGALARLAHAELIVGAKQLTPSGEYNALYAFRPDGALDAIYRKRLLVPFVEALPAPRLLGRLPAAALISRFAAGTSSGVIGAGGLRVGPLICWESAFDGAAHEAVRDGAQALVVATDDAWFGTTAGPYQHAQIAQMRALENGTWLLRAAATGISGIVAPNGRYVRSSSLGRIAIVEGGLGRPQPTLYSRIGPLPIGLALFATYAAVFAVRRRRAR
jgi:apolipoprotein N-acyltransferase